MDIPRGAATTRSRSMWHDVLQGLHEVGKYRRLLALVLIAAFTSFFGRGYNAYMPVFAERVLHVGVRELGFLMSGPGLGTVVASLTVATAGNLHYKGKIGILGNLLFAVLLSAYAWAQTIAVSYVLLILVGGVFMVCQSVINTAVQLITRNEVRGRVTSVFTLTGLAVMPLGQAPLGALIERVGPSLAVTSFAGILFCSTLAIGMMLPQLWHMD
jgi:MFS family permease